MKDSSLQGSESSNASPPESDAKALKKRVRELRNRGQEEERERKGRPVTLKLVDKPAPPVLDDDGEWTGKVASWFIEEGVEQGLVLDPMPGQILKETDRAVLFRREDNHRKVWVPRSAVESVEARGEVEVGGS